MWINYNANTCYTFYYGALKWIRFFLQIKRNETGAKFTSFRSVLSLLSYLCKAPLVPNGSPVVNSLFRQRSAIENILRACVGLPPNSHIALEHRVRFFWQIISIVFLKNIFRNFHRFNWKITDKWWIFYLKRIWKILFCQMKFCSEKKLILKVREIFSWNRLKSLKCLIRLVNQFPN